jgi:hypothetical protein
LRLVICAWRSSDAKNHMSDEDFVDLCQRVVDHHRYTSSPRT